MSSPGRTLDRVLFATDLSEFGNRAAAVAFAAVASGGCVTLVHVIREAPLPSPLVPHYGKPRPSDVELLALERKAAAALTALAKPAAEARGVRFEARVVRAQHVVDGLLAEVERIDADLICFATHSRSGLAELVLGSTANEVLNEAGRPVLLVPSPVER